MSKRKYYPLTQMQFIMLCEKLRAFNKEVAEVDASVCFWVFDDKHFNADAMEKAFNKLVSVNDALRIRLAVRPNGLKQYIYDDEFVNIPKGTCADKDELLKIAYKMYETPIKLFNNRLYNAKIFDCKNGTGGLAVKLSHFICDGYSFGIMFKQFDEFYKAYCEGREPEVKKIYSYTDQIKAHRKYVHSKQYAADRRWWRKKYNSQRDFKLPVKATGSDLTNSHKVFIEDEMYDRVVAFCKEVGCSVQSFVSTMAAFTVCAVTGCDNFQFASLFHGRASIPAKRTVGCLVNSFFDFYDLGKGLNAKECISDAYMEYLESLSHGNYSTFGQVSFPYLPSLKNNFCFNYGWIKISAMDFAAIKSTLELDYGALPFIKSNGQFYSSVLDIKPERKLAVQTAYNVRVASKEQMERFGNIFMSCVSLTLDSPETDVKEIVNKALELNPENVTK